MVNSIPPSGSTPSVPPASPQEDLGQQLQEQWFVVEGDLADGDYSGLEATLQYLEAPGGLLAQMAQSGNASYEQVSSQITAAIPQITGIISAYQQAETAYAQFENFLQNAPQPGSDYSYQSWTQDMTVLSTFLSYLQTNFPQSSVIGEIQEEQQWQTNNNLQDWPYQVSHFNSAWASIYPQIQNLMQAPPSSPNFGSIFTNLNNAINNLN